MNIALCLKQIPFIIKSKNTPENKIKTAKYIAKLHMQYCAILSQQNNHAEAVEHAKYGAKYNHLGFQEIYKIFEAYSVKPNASIIESTARKIVPILKQLISRLIPEDGKTSVENTSVNFDMRNLFGFLPCDDSVVSLNIGCIMQLAPLSTLDILSECEIHVELTRESLLERISLLVISYFCISTETRFVAQERTNNIDLKESEYFHAKALEMACKFLPSECPLVSHIYMTYQKHYSVIQEVIVKLLIKYSQKMDKQKVILS